MKFKWKKMPREYSPVREGTVFVPGGSLVSYTGDDYTSARFCINPITPAIGVPYFELHVLNSDSVNNARYRFVASFRTLKFTKKVAEQMYQIIQGGLHP